MIPKIIHQTWKTKDIPDNWKEAVKSCKTINNDYTHILWTDENMDKFVKEYYPYLHNLYKSYKYNIQRCDVFRYLVLYKYGGIYLDMDIICKKKITEFLNYNLVLTYGTSWKSSFTNAFFMCIPENPFIKYCIDNLCRNINKYQYFGKHLHVMNSTGPSFLTNMVKQYGKIENSYILHNKEFCGDCNVCNENTCIGGTYFSHTTGNTWHEIDSTIYNFIFCKRLIIGIIFIILVIFILLRIKCNNK